MSLLNQPTRLVVSGDDAEWSNNASTGGQTINLTLPEPIVGANGVDCARAIIPNTQYPVPAYQSIFYYTLNGVQDSVLLTSARNFTSVQDLITQLNIDATNQSKPVVFTYDSTTTRISATISSNTPLVVITAGLNDSLQIARVVSGITTTHTTNVVPGTYSVLTFSNIINVEFNNVCIALDPAYSSGNATIGVGNIATFNLGTSAANVFLDFTTGYTATQTAALVALYGVASASSPFTTGSVVGTQAIQVGPLSAAVSPRTSWPTRFALNTRLGFPNTGITGTAGTAIVGTFLPNILRTRVLYLLCNISLNDSISTDGLRTILAKIPVNSSYGGLTIYEQKDYNFCRIVQSSYQNVEISLIDDNYQPYQLTIEEPMEIEFVFTYEPVTNG